MPCPTRWNVTALRQIICCLNNIFGEKMIDLLSQTPFFQDIDKGEIRAILKALCAREKSYKKGEIVMESGVQTHEFGIVLHGKVIIEHGDIWGNVTILGTIETSGNFAVPYACLRDQVLPFSVQAQEPSSILFIDAARMIACHTLPCAIHTVLMRNLLVICARRNLHLAQRALHTSSKTIRGRLLAYLSDLMNATHSATVTLPYNRQQLAQYLGVERSALSNELSKMQKEGILVCDKNRVTLLSYTRD